MLLPMASQKIYFLLFVQRIGDEAYQIIMA